jgi:hypothetical protein
MNILERCLQEAARGRNVMLISSNLAHLSANVNDGSLHIQCPMKSRIITVKADLIVFDGQPESHIRDMIHKYYPYAEVVVL